MTFNSNTNSERCTKHLKIEKRTIFDNKRRTCRHYEAAPPLTPLCMQITPRAPFILNARSDRGIPERASAVVCNATQFHDKTGQLSVSGFHVWRPIHLIRFHLLIKMITFDECDQCHGRKSINTVV